MTALTEDYNVTRERDSMMLQDSKDEKVRKAGVQVKKTGRDKKA